VYQAARPEGWQKCLPIGLDGVRRLERQQGDVAARDEQRDLVLFRLAPPAPQAADIALLASTDGCYGYSVCGEVYERLVAKAAKKKANGKRRGSQLRIWFAA